MKLQISHAGLSDRGRVREQNEDNWCADPDFGLYIVSDGLGGHFAGGLASQIVVETLPSFVRERMGRIRKVATATARKRLEACLSELSQGIFDQTRDKPGFEGMGATVVLALVKGGQALIAHMGDSRAYLFRDGSLDQLTKDHSIVQLLLDHGEITPEEALTHPARGQVTCSMGMEGEPLPEIRPVDLHPADRLMLCTDGLTGMLSDGEIAATLKKEPGPEAACRVLVEAANQAGGNDNITAVVIDASA